MGDKKKTRKSGRQEAEKLLVALRALDPEAADKQAKKLKKAEGDEDVAKVTKKLAKKVDKAEAKRQEKRHEKKAESERRREDAERAAAELAAPATSKAKKADRPATLSTAMQDALRVTEGFSLADLDAGSTPGFTGDKADAEEVMASFAGELSELQERLYAEGRSGGGRSLLLVVQGMDTSGKGGIMRHVVGLFDPQGVDITAFKQPTPEERRHPFLWRIRRALPEAGQVGVFDRSHYEDVLVVRVNDLVPPSTWGRRYGQINTFEKSVASKGITMVKVMLHVSSQEQQARLTERLERPDKHWKYNPGDVDERRQWPAYEEAYQAVLDRTSTDVAPWYVVPADHKWYARLAVQQLLLEHLRQLDPQWPKADFDVAKEKKRLAGVGAQLEQELKDLEQLRKESGDA